MFEIAKAMFVVFLVIGAGKATHNIIGGKESNPIDRQISKDRERVYNKLNAIREWKSLSR